jgi:hypothetical protein
MTATSRTRTTALHACNCRNFEAGNRIDVEGGDVDFVDVRTTGCNASTTRLFAQGHDAKLVSFLVAAELDNLEIALVGQGSSWGRAEDAARTISDALAIKAANMIATAQAKAAKKANKPARKATKVAAEPTTREATIKRGRWTYAATIDTKTQWATYTDKKGNLVSVASTDYKEV